MNAGWTTQGVDGKWEWTDDETGDTRPIHTIDTGDAFTLPDKVIIDLAEASIGFGLNPANVDWERFYEMLESQYGYDMQDLGGTADNRIRRRVSVLRKAERINW